MPLVVTCTTCGLVNEGWGKHCSACGAKLSSLRFYRPHLRPGMRERISRLSPSIRIMNRPTGREVRTPDGELVYVRRAWASRGRPLSASDADDLQDEAVGLIEDLGFAPPYWSGGAPVIAAVLYPLFLAASLVATTLRWLDYVGRVGFELLGRVAFRRPWVVEVYRGNPSRIFRSFRVRGYQNAGRVIEELVLAYQIGDPDFVPKGVVLP